MCLTVNKKLDSPLIADKQIIVFKNGDFKIPFFPFQSFFLEYSYRRFKIQKKVDLWKERKYYTNETYIVDRGYHSFNRPIMHNNLDLSVFVIPENSKYYEGYDNDDENIKARVSESIVWVGNILNPITWITLLGMKIGLIKFKLK